MPRRLFTPCVLVVAALRLGVAPVAAADPSRILVPAYGNPCCGSGQELWRALIAAARPGVMDVILNPNSGPGAGPIDSNYVGSEGQAGPLIELSRAGAAVHGYVHTRWGRRDLAAVLGEIDRYFDATYYRGADIRLDGIFIDEMSNDLADLGYYQAILQHVRTKSEAAIVIGNPGTASVLDSSNGAAGFSVTDYATLFHRLVTFEDNGITYRNAFALPRWIRDLPAERFVHIVHSDAALDKMTINVQLAASRNVGTLYVTDDVLPNPYDRLPSYWDQLLAAIVPAVAIDELSCAIRVGSTNHHYDLNQDGNVDPVDRRYWVESIAQTTFGDANLDGRFDSQDLVDVLRAGQYQDQRLENSLWSTGDWNGDGEFDSSDLVTALETGSYETSAVFVPEPGSHGDGLFYSLVWLCGNVLRRKSSC